MLGRPFSSSSSSSSFSSFSSYRISSPPINCRAYGFMWAPKILSRITDADVYPLLLPSPPLPYPPPTLAPPPRPSISFPPLSSLPRPPWPVLRTSTCRPQFPSPPPPHKSDDLQVLFHPVSRSDGNLMVASHVLLLVIFSCGSVCRWQWRLGWILT